MLKHAMTSLTLCLLATISAPPSAMAGDGNALALVRWYAALGGETGVVDKDTVGAMLADDAAIDLKDLGIIQTRDEFLTSLDEWTDAIAGGTIRHKVTADTPDETRTTVCYAFADNAMLTEETFRFAKGRIMSSVQTTLADNCDGF
jgi:hypothetical protein